MDWSGKYVLDLEKLIPEEFKRGEGQDDLLSEIDKLKVEVDSETGQTQEEGNMNGGDKDDDDGDRPHFSLISGTYVHRRKFNNKSTTPAQLPASSSSSEQALQLSSASSGGGAHEDSVVVRNPTTGEMTTVLETASIQHLNKRGWKGLEQRLGMDEPSELEEGREGIAKGYKDAGGAGNIM